VAEHSRVENETELREQPATLPGEGREPWPEEAEQPSRGERARSYFREHPRARWILIIFLLVVVTGCTYLWHYYSIRETTDDAQVDGHIVPVGPRVGGTVISVDVADNQYVDRGAVLVQLDPKDYQVAVDRARADLATAEAAAAAARTGIPITTTTTTSNVSTAEANLFAARKEVDAAEARAREAEANYSKASSDLKRAQQLVVKDEISQQQYDAVKAAAEAAKAGVDAAVAAIAAAQSHVVQAEAGVHSARTAPQQVAVTKSRAAEADAAAQRSRAALQQAELNLTYTTVRAPFAGVVSKRSVEPGQVVTAGQPFFALVDLEDVYVTANYKETQLQHMCPGQPATIHVDAFNHDYRGHVDSLSGVTGARTSLLPPENATGNYVKVVQRIPAKVVFDQGEDPNHQLRPGMSVEPTVLVDKPCSHPFGENTQRSGPEKPNQGAPAGPVGTGTAPGNTRPGNSTGRNR
jgi:membrane fusion protein (multidrug efflux system)